MTFGPGLRVKATAAEKRTLIAKAKRLRRKRAGFLFWCLLTGALTRRDIDRAFRVEAR